MKKELNNDIIYILDDIAEKLNMETSVVKVIYIVFLEAQQGDTTNLKALNFIPKQLYKQVISELKDKLIELGV